MKSAECPLRCHVSLMLIPESSPPPTDSVSNFTPESDLAPGVVSPSMRGCGGSAPAGPVCNDAVAAPPAGVVASLGFLRLVVFGRRLAAALSTFTTAAPGAAAAPGANLMDDSWRTSAHHPRHQWISFHSLIHNFSLPINIPILIPGSRNAKRK